MNLGTRMGSVKSAHRRAGKVKGIERFLGTLETQSQELMETSSGKQSLDHLETSLVRSVLTGASGHVPLLRQAESRAPRDVLR